MTDAIFARLLQLFDVPRMQNNLRGLWVEAMICELLAGDWHHVGADWAPWDLERQDGLRIEVKQSARYQSWGTSRAQARFDIAPSKGHYLPNGRFEPNTTGTRLSDLYIFAWHEGQDQRTVGDWQFHVIAAAALPPGQKTLAFSRIRAMAAPVHAGDLRHHVAHEAAKLASPTA